MTRRIPKAAAKAELLRRKAASAPPLTPEAIANGHTRQLELLNAVLDPDVHSILAVCARQVGKTEGAIGALALVMSATPSVECLYLGLNDEAAGKVFERKWKPFCTRFQIPCDHVGRTTKFANNSYVVFGGIDDARHASSFLGGSMAGGLAVVDEAQSQPGIIDDVLRDIIDPMISQVTEAKPRPGKIIISGTCPKVHAGFFWNLWRQGLNNDLDIIPGQDAWFRINFSRFDNVHLGDVRGMLDKSNARYKTTDDDPIIQRNWFGNYKLIQADLTAFGYRETNGYQGNPAPWANGLELPPGKLIATLPPDGVDTFAIGIDPAATSDRWSGVVWGWSSRAPLGVWQIAEWVTDRAANALDSQWLAALQTLVGHYKPCIRVIRDDGSTASTDDVSLREYGLVIEPAKKGKGSKKARVERMKDLLGSNRAHILIGSQLERDLQLARLDREARAVGKYEWTADIHPDVADAATYGVVAYIEADAQKVWMPETVAQVAEQLFRNAFTPSRVNYGGPSDTQRGIYDDNGSYGGPQD